MYRVLVLLHFSYLPLFFEDGDRGRENYGKIINNDMIRLETHMGFIQKPFIL